MGAPDTGSVPYPVPPQERRRYVRVKRGVSVTYSVIGRPEPGTVRTSARDLGLGGLLLTTPEALRPGTRLLLVLLIRNADIELHLHGEVVWCDHDPTGRAYETGIGFRGLDAAQRKNILALIAGSIPSRDGMEQRHFIRLRKALPVKYRVRGKVGGKWRVGSVQDLSVGGFAIATDESLEKGTRLKLRIGIDDDLEEPLELMADVTRNAAQAGVPGRFLMSGRFRDVPTKAFERLAAYISKHVLTPREAGAGG